LVGVGTDNAGVLVLAATNIPWALDTAIQQQYHCHQKSIEYLLFKIILDLKSEFIFHYLRSMNEKLCLKCT
jgi:AAA+ superfamily predicted ATPase